MSDQKQACPCEGDQCLMDADDHRHGTENGYGNLRCRCEACRAAHATYFREGPGRQSVTRYRRRNSRSARLILATASHFDASVSESDFNAIVAAADEMKRAAS